MDDNMIRSKLIPAPNVKKQDQTGETEITVYVGSQAWDFSKAELPRNADEIALSESLGESKYFPPVIISDEILSEIEKRQIAPKNTQFLKLHRANHGQPLKADRLTALCLNLAENNPFLHSVTLLNEAGELEEELTAYIKELRTNKEKQDLAKLAIDSGKSEEQKQAEYLSLFEKLSPKERLIEFLEWGKYAFAFNQSQGNAIYTFTGIKWERLSKEMISRLINSFFVAKGYLKYGQNQIDNIIKCIASSDEYVPLMNEPNPEFLAFRNGILHKRTGEFKPHSKENYLLSFIDTNYRKEQQATPNFDKWLNFVSEEKAERRDRILAALYMILTNRYEWQLFLEIIGEGRSGKSTFTAIAELLAGAENTASISLKNLENPVTRCNIINKTLVISPDQKRYIGEGEELKNITGGDLIQFNPKYETPFQERVKCTFVITGNEPMIFTENNGGIDRRRVIFKFDRQVPKEQRDHYLIEKIKAELNGVINLLLEKFKDPYHALKLIEDQMESDEAMKVKEETDHLLDFLNAFHTKEENLARGLYLGRPKTMYQDAFKEYLQSAYDLYCRINDITKPISKNRFRDSIEKAIKKKRMHPTLKISLIDGKNRTNIYFNNVHTIEDEWRNS
ncbi:phage/plasmid primase, P4 family [Glaesserella sp.]|uniref:DNA primase family protein n=1 Tax=Glaesserella sp. TaxID=2094731 RepID=UPI0035A1B4DC